MTGPAGRRAADDSAAIRELWSASRHTPRWAGMTIGDANPAGPDGVLFTRAWQDGTVDALRLHADPARPPAEAWRTGSGSAPGVVWRRTGAVAPVITELLELADPGRREPELLIYSGLVSAGRLSLPGSAARLPGLAGRH